MSELSKRLRAACDGHPHAKIEWPHRVLHEAADALDAKDREIAELRGANAALIAERASLIETKREQIDRLHSHWTLAEDQVAEQIIFLNALHARLSATVEALKEVMPSFKDAIQLLDMYGAPTEEHSGVYRAARAIIDQEGGGKPS